MDDLALVRDASRGNQAAFQALAERYRSYIYTIAYRIVLDEDDALDTTQDVFLRLLEKLGDYDGRGPFRAWLGTLTAREAISHNRRRARAPIPEPPEILNQIADQEQESSDVSQPGNPRDAAMRNERRTGVEQAMRELSPQQRAIFAMRFQEDMDPQEIAERLGISGGQARCQLHRAVAALRKMLTQKG